MRVLVYLNRAYFSLPDSIWQDVSENENVNQVIAYINDHLSEDLSWTGWQTTSM